MKKTDYRKMRRILWIIYIGLFLVVIAFNTLVKGATELAAIALAALICAFLPVFICSCVFTHQARVEDRAAYKEAMERLDLNLKSVNRFLTEKCLKGEENGWAEDVLIWILGIPAVGMAAFEMFTDVMGSGFGKWLTVFLSLAIGFFIIYMLVNRKIQRRRAREYALLFASAGRKDYLYSALANDAQRGNAPQEVIRLLKRNYLMNIENDSERQQINIIEFRRLPKNAYVCGNCGAAVSITVGDAIICKYCGKPLV